MNIRNISSWDRYIEYPCLQNVTVRVFLSSIDLYMFEKINVRPYERLQVQAVLLRGTLPMGYFFTLQVLK